MSLWNDTRFALRQLRKSPGFALIVVVTLALCIGANTAIFSIIDAVFLRPLPYPQADRLALVTTAFTRGSLENARTSQDGASWELVRDHANLIDAAPYSEMIQGVNLAVGDSAQFVQQQRVGAGFFRVLGVAPAFGREFTREEDVPGGPALAVLSHALWQRLYHGDPTVIGRSVQLRGEPFTIVGVMPQGFRTDSPEAELWTPLRPSIKGEGEGTNYGIVARLKDGVSWAQATGQLTSIFQPFFAKQKIPAGVVVEQRAAPMQLARTADLRREFGLMWGAVLIVLLIGCINIAGILLARAATRRREIATRMALGAGRGIVIRQLMTEGLLLSIAGGLLGLVVGHYTLALLQWLSAVELWRTPQLDARVMLFMLSVSVFTSLIFGLFPAFDATRIDIRGALADGGRGLAGSRSVWKRQLLVFVEVAMGVTLVISAGLLIRTLSYLNGQNPGFDPQGVTMANVSLQDARYQTVASVNQLFRATLERIERIPGVESAAVSLTGPYERALNSNVRSISGRTDLPTTLTNFTYVTPTVFETLRMPIQRGRGFTGADNENSQPVIVVNEAFVARMLRDQEPLGASVNMGGTGYVVIGIVKSVMQRNGFGPEFGPVAALPQIYAPASQVSAGLLKLVHVWFSPAWLIRTRGEVTGLQESVRAAIASVDPLLPLSSFQRISEVRDHTLGAERYRTFLFSALGGLAVLLSALGVYGLIAQSVVERRREMGIRLALGASMNQILRSATAPGLILATAGVVVGIGGAWFAGSLMKSLIWGIQATDTATYASAAAFLLVVAGVASLLPALRLFRIDPVTTLREE
jgi:predicted permease